MSRAAEVAKLIQELNRIGEGVTSSCAMLWHVDRPKRSRLFLKISKSLTDEEYWPALRELWMDTEFPNRSRQVWLELFTSNRQHREVLMSDADWTAFAVLPEKVRIFRGAGMKHARGLSWTTNRDKAVWFQRRFGGDARVFGARVAKSNILAYFTGRRESEVVIDPRRIHIEPDSRMEKLTPGFSLVQAGISARSNVESDS